jgi:hypothetical protein
MMAERKLAAVAARTRRWATSNGWGWTRAAGGLLVVRGLCVVLGTAAVVMSYGLMLADSAWSATVIGVGARLAFDLGFLMVVGGLVLVTGAPDWVRRRWLRSS